MYTYVYVYAKLYVCIYLYVKHLPGTVCSSQLLQLPIRAPIELQRNMEPRPDPRAPAGIPPCSAVSPFGICGAPLGMFTAPIGAALAGPLGRAPLGIGGVYFGLLVQWGAV